MFSFLIFPNLKIESKGLIAQKFLNLKISTFHRACEFVHHLPYGYNSDKDNPEILFIEQKGSCTTKHGVIAKLADELEIPVQKNVGIYQLTEEIVTGVESICKEFHLPYIPMVHCVLKYQEKIVDLTFGNLNGKKKSIDEFIHLEPVIPFISRKDEYILYRNVVKNIILPNSAIKNASMKEILQAREQAIHLLHTAIGE